MCDACIMESVKQRMLSRRGFFRAAAVGTAGIAAASMGIAPAALAAGHTSVTDLTHELYEEFPTYFGQQQFFREQKFSYASTHVDAPLHFSADGMSVAELPVEKLIVPLCVVDIREKAAGNADAQITPDDIKAWIGANGDIPENACVAML